MVPPMQATELGSIPLTIFIDSWRSGKAPPRQHQFFCAMVLWGIVMTYMSCHVTANGAALALAHAVLTTCQQLVRHEASSEICQLSTHAE